MMGYVVKKSKALTRNRITVDQMIFLSKIALELRPEYNYFKHTITFAFLRLGQKYLQLDMVDEAIQVAFQTSNMQLVHACRTYAKRKHNVVVLHIIDYHIERYAPNS